MAIFGVIGGLPSSKNILYGNRFTIGYPCGSGQAMQTPRHVPALNMLKYQASHDRCLVRVVQGLCPGVDGSVGKNVSLKTDESGAMDIESLYQCLPPRFPVK